MLITKQMLEDAKTARNQPVTSTHFGKMQAEVFNREWPDGMELTLENCLRMRDVGLSINWVVQYLLPPKMQREYLLVNGPAKEVFEESMRYTEEIYEKTISPAWEIRDEDISHAEQIRDRCLAYALHAVVQNIVVSPIGFDLNNNH